MTDKLLEDRKKYIGSKWVSTLSGTEIEIIAIDDNCNFFFYHGKAKQTKCCLSNVEFFRIYKEIK